MIVSIALCFIIQLVCAQEESVKLKDDADISLPLMPLTGHVVQQKRPLLNGVIFVGTDDRLPNGQPAVGFLEAPGVQHPPEVSPPGSAGPPGLDSAPGTSATIRPRRTRRPTTIQQNETEATTKPTAIQPNETETATKPTAIQPNETETTTVSQLAASTEAPVSESNNETQEAEPPATESPDANIYVVRNCDIVTCNSISRCKVIDNEAKCIRFVGDKIGHCPARGEAAKPEDDTTCNKPCTDDQSCRDDLKCCRIACGKSCHKPRPNNPCDAKPCAKGTRCVPVLRACQEAGTQDSPCPQYNCEPIATKVPPISSEP